MSNSVENHVSIVIPTFNESAGIRKLLEGLTKQSMPLDEIIVVDSTSDDGTTDIVLEVAAKAAIPIRLEIIPHEEFDHGGTRDRALREWATGEFVLYMTGDAYPADERYVENLLAPFQDDRVAVVSGRQLPKPDARRFEQLVRNFNYPSEPLVRGVEDVDSYGIKTFFTTDVCAAYRRDVLLECGGFPTRCIINEDMYVAAKLLRAGYLAAYAANACVRHSHNYTLAQQYKRNWAVGYFLENNKDLLMVGSELGEGGKLVKAVSVQLLREGRIGEFFAFGVDCAARLLGNRKGRGDARRNG